MMKLKIKYRVYDVRNQENWRFVGVRNIYISELGNTYILYDNMYIPCSMLGDSKGKLYVTDFSTKYAIHVVHR